MLRFRRLLSGAISAVLMSLLFLHAPAQGDDGVKAMKEKVATQPAPAVERDGDLDREIAAARLSVKDDPSNASRLVRLAELLVKKGALDEAMLSFDEALKINPRSHDAKTGRGIVLARRGSLQEAEGVLKEALVLNPNPVRTHYELGLVYEKLGDLEKALAELKEGLRKHEQGR
jgi:tetratricopeptide (TPR) repeat protein